MKPLPIHSIPSRRMALLTEARRLEILQARAARHEKPWWNSNEDDGQEPKGCAAALLPASIFLYIAGWAVIHFLL